VSVIRVKTKRRSNVIYHSRPDNSGKSEGAAIIVKEDKKEVREYLLGRLSEADEELLELRLLTDPAYGEEFDTVVDEITDDYVTNELQGAERERAEKYFLSSPERQQKLEFASELIRRAEDERGKPAEVRRVATSKPSLLEQFWAFWKKQSFAPLAATAAAIVLTFSLLVFIIQQRNNPSTENYAQVHLELSSSDRAEGARRQRVAMPEHGLKLHVSIPEQARGAKDYRVKMFDVNGVEQDLEIETRDEQRIIVAVPASVLSRGSYSLQLSSVKADGSEQRVPRSYYLDIE
jgi:hypothetical protein